jgi:hypothetical protein
MALPTSTPSLKPSTKRSYTPSFDDFGGDNEDAENVNPSSPTKRTKIESSLKSSTFHFTLNPPKSMPPPSSTTKSRLHTPTKYSGVTKPSTRTPLSAPAGRSPKSKRSTIRGLSAHTTPTRRDAATLSRTALPFSIDAALNASLTKSAPAVASVPKPASSIQESMPSSWFFAIHEDTAEEEAENLMEHSTLTLDLSSDDDSSTKANEDRGKENVAPTDYLLSPTRRARRSIKSAVDMDTDHAVRAPLAFLDTAEFIPAGLTKDSTVILDEAPERCAADEPAADEPAADEQEETVSPIIVTLPKQPSLGEIFIFEDESASPAPSTGGKRKRSAEDDDDHDE